MNKIVGDNTIIMNNFITIVLANFIKIEPFSHEKGAIRDKIT